MYELYFSLAGVALIGLGVWFWSKDMVKPSLLAIGFGLLGLGAGFWSPAMFLGIVLLFLVVIWVRLESNGL